MFNALMKSCITNVSSVILNFLPALNPLVIDPTPPLLPGLALVVLGLFAFIVENPIY
jgi:hypothetical protein